jgi:peptidoglycan/LPS O-acetylase OafA/YrhL
MTGSTLRLAERRALWAVVIAVGLVALGDGHGQGGVKAWPLLACLGMWLAALGFGMMASALRAEGRPYAPVLALAGAATLIALWSSIAQLIAWWSAGEALFFGIGLAAALLALAALARAARAFAIGHGLRLPGT